MLNNTEIYNAIRTEIITNHTLMHWYSIIVAVVLLAGIWLVETKQTILSVFLPLVSVSWAAAMVRFDFFIHRQGAYLRFLESQMTNENSTPLWETWKASLRATVFVVSIADLFAVMAIVIPTLYLLFGPAHRYFQVRQWNGGNLYAWGLSTILALLLLSLLIIPKLAA